MTEIPKDIMETAYRVALNASGTLHERIASAILDERERCAKIGFDRWATHRAEADRIFEQDEKYAVKISARHLDKADEAWAIAQKIRGGSND